MIRFIVLAACTTILMIHQTHGAAIPIWELLTHEEKMGRLFYVFVHLVQQYCKTSDIPDCPKVLTLYGMSNLVSEDEHSLDLMDPYQRDAKTIVWERIMRGEFKLPTKLAGKPLKPVQQQNKISGNAAVHSSPYEIRVRPPPGYVTPAPVIARPSSDPSNNEADGSPSGLTVLRLRRSSEKLEDRLLPVLSEKDAQQLLQLID